jgi:hypothetical protein
MKDRRTKEGFRLRAYMDAIREVRTMTDEQWTSNFVLQKGGSFIPRITYLAYLEHCALVEAEKLLKPEAA